MNFRASQRLTSQVESVIYCRFVIEGLPLSKRLITNYSTLERNNVRVVTGENYLMPTPYCHSRNGVFFFNSEIIKIFTISVIVVIIVTLVF